MTSPHAEMIDLVFEISGGTLPIAYHYELWDELTRLVPQLGECEEVGVIPLRMASSNEGMLIPKRAKLALRLPLELADIVSALAQKQMQVANSELQLGSCKTRPIQHYPTLHAHLVTGADDELSFIEEVSSALAAMGVEAKLICGQRHTLANGERTISGYSLVLHDLNPEDSLRVQYTGLGKERRFGCGIFVPYKVISGLE
ncbi:type I-MYXAN CRISPR-associated protein Cas6/Cmx6 [Sideroxydans lithotrophicus]|uniref:CRISPR-associated protein, Cas6-related protein n=1 Tax=Sideroxydans lithotrophicus (strain ES-1) TaxID=580332 RepID=D5CSI5_SIDLE|nr:type I-MYXAN CRISPR-associated protein Cas6/Cmx6 [Sideroxydans lithotrophicus]ADE11921.1 CRISPR-associated protein, Cas6-related protein [Sideroxydans lithotrophicus ES-1]